MKIGKRLAAVLLCLWLVLPSVVRAAESADAGCAANLCLTFRCGERPLRDMPVALYAVALSDGQGELTVTEAFAPFAAAVRGGDEAAWRALTAAWEAHIAASALSPAAVGVTDGGGCVRFPEAGAELPPGLYFVPGIRCASGDGVVYQTQPFPVLLDGGVEAYPKCGESDGPRLPQTGQLWWPVPLLALAGAALMAAGILRRRGGRRG